MSWPDCRGALLHAQELLNANGEAADEMRKLLRLGADGRQQLQWFYRWTDEATRDQVRTEFEELPPTVISLIASSWASAEAAGVPFRVEAAAPISALAMARSRRVELLVNFDDDGVLVTLSHLRGRHAEWYRAVA